MKAAVIYQQGNMPEYVDFPEPIISSDDELLVSVKAVAIKHFDKGRAAGKHYSSETPENTGKVIGGDGVCMLADGTRVFATGVSGMLAEKAVIEKGRMVKLPDEVSDAEAAALPNAVIGSAMALKFKANIQRADVVLINGATGFTGRVAVQLAKYYGAKKVVVTGRNDAALRELIELGADEIISFEHGDEDFISKIKKLHAASPIDIIIDYLWGHSAELLLGCLKGKGSFTHPTRFVSVGSVTGDIIQLSAANLRSVNLQLSGSGLGSWSKDEVRKLFQEILPETFQLLANGQLKLKTIQVPMKDIASLWDLEIPGGQRLVVMV